MIPWLYKYLPIIFGCHCIDSRCFHYHGRRFPICARCTGELAGLLLAAALLPFWRLALPWCILLMCPMLLDGGLQALTAYESNNIKRFITGLLFGFGLAALFVKTSAWAFEAGKQAASALLARRPLFG